MFTNNPFAELALVLPAVAIQFFCDSNDFISCTLLV